MLQQWGLQVMGQRFIYWGLGAFALLHAGLAMATDARLHVLQSPAGIDDPSLLFLYPALSADKSSVFAEIGTPNADAYGGALYTLEFGTLGLFVSRDASLMQSTYPVVSNGSDIVARLAAPWQLSRKYLGTVAPLPARPLDLIYSRPVGAGSLGLRITFAGEHNKTENGPAKTTISSDQLDVGLGYSGKTSGARFDTGLTVGVLGSVENVTENAGVKQEQNYTRGVSLNLNGRYIRPMGGRTEAVAKLGLSYASPEIEATNAGTSQDKDITETTFDLQGGVNIKAGASTTAYTNLIGFYAQSKGPFAFGAAGGSTIPASLAAGTETLNLSLTEGTSEKSVYGLLASVGLETQVSKSWHVLGGMTYPLFGSGSAKDKVTANSPKYEYRLSDVADAELWTLGLGYQAGALRIDASANAKALLHTGPFLLTGNNLGGAAAQPLLVAISASYDLGPSSSAPDISPSSLPPAPEVIAPSTSN